MNKISYILFVAVFFLAQTICAQENATASAQAKLVKIEYQSIDEFNQPVTLSATVTVPANGRVVSSVMLSNTSRNRLSSVAADKAETTITPWASVAAKGVAIVEPDNFVAGGSKLRAIPKFTYDLAGRQSIDALSAAISYLKKNGMISSENYSSYILGYGFGANISLAAQRSLENDYTAEQKAEIRLRNTYCDNIAATPSKIWSEAVNSGVTYSAYNTIVMLDNILKTYAESCMKSFTEKDIFSEKLLSSHIIDFIYSNNFSEAQINQMLQKTFGTENPSLDLLISSDLSDSNSAVRRAVEKAANKNTIEGWTPQYNVSYVPVCSPNLENIDINKIIEILKKSIITAEDLFLSSVFNQIFGTDSIEIPILMYYSNSILSGSLVIEGNLDVNLNVTMYSLFMEKTADVALTVSPDIISTVAGRLPGKVKIGYYQQGWINMDIDANNVIPVVQNISGLISDSPYGSQEEAENAAAELNASFNTFDIAINEVKKWFTGTIGTTEGSEEGTYKLDLLFNRDGKHISLSTIMKLL